jgi:hypothetical protein
MKSAQDEHKRVLAVEKILMPLLRAIDSPMEREHFIGDGRFCALVHAARPDVAVMGVDYSQTSITKLKTSDLGKHVKFVYGNAFNLANDVGTGFDCILSNGMIEHYTRAQAADLVHSMKLATAPSGFGIIGVPNRLHLPHEILKWAQGTEYRYYPEESFWRPELSNLVGDHFDIVEEFGVSPEWGIQRMDFVHPALGALGKMLTHPRKVLDALTNNWVSDILGYEIFVVGTPKE